MGLTCKERRALMNLEELWAEILLYRREIFGCEEKSKIGPGWHNYGKMIMTNLLRTALEEYADRVKQS